MMMMIQTLKRRRRNWDAVKEIFSIFNNIILNTKITMIHFYIITNDKLES